MSDTNLREALKELARGQSLSCQTCQLAVREIMAGEVDPVLIAAFLMGLRVKGETVDELEGCALEMRQRSVEIRVQRRPLVDTCGTGGDGASTFNISTASALVVAGAGVAVAKHGNRSVSSKCGSADVLEALGFSLVSDPATVAASVDEVGFGFLFAPHFHPAMKFVGPTRKALGLRTVFNLLGPLSNPAGALHQVIGVFSPEWVEPVAHLASRLGLKSCLVVHGAGGLDEFSLAGENRVAWMRDGQVETFSFDPSEAGFPRSSLQALAGGGPEENAAIIRGVLQGRDGPARQIVELNAAAALLAVGTCSDWKEAALKARQAITSGAALEVLERARSFTAKSD